MPDHPSSHRDLSALYEQRRKTRDTDIAVMNIVERAIFGHLPIDYERLFTEKDVKIQLRTLRAADDGLTKFLSEIPILPHVDVLGKRNSDTQRDKAELAEKITYGWYNGSAMRGGVSFDGITFQLARHQVRFADAVLVICPDYENKLVYLEVMDPRCHYPPEGYSPFSQTALDKTLLVWETTLGEVKARFGYDSYGQAKTDVLMRLENAYANKYGYGSGIEHDDSTTVKVGVYRSKEAWFFSCLADTDVMLFESQAGDKGHPGVCGVASFKQFASEPLLIGQIGIEAGLMKVANQQIQNTERINKATTIGPPLLGDTLRIGEYNEVNMQLMQGRAFQPYRLAPDNVANLTQVLGQFLALSDRFSYNPESSQGQGPANSGKAIQQLQAGPRTLVTNILFGPYKPAFSRVHDDCLEMELNLWPNDKKTAIGYKGRQRHEVEYTPSAALQGFKGHIKIEEPRAGGYNAFLEAVQKRDAGMLDLRSTLEKDPDVRDVETTLRRIDSESIEKFAQAAFEGLGSQDPLTAIKISAEIKKRIDEGKSKFEAIQEVVAAGMLEPPAPPEQAMPELPPELQGMLGGGAPELPPAPSLASARGF